MSKINLHYILQYLTDDENFLSTVIEENYYEKYCNIKDKNKKKNNFSIVTDMMTEYFPLVPYEKQNCSLFPIKFKCMLPPNYARFGIINIIEKDLNTVNISFLNSLNILLRPDTYKLGLEEHNRNILLLESFLVHKIQRNYQIDKIKNTKKMQEFNKKMVKDLLDGRISHELIQRIINIFEINLVVFDLVKMDIYLYWSSGYIYPYFNFFKNVYCMCFVQGNYEPIMVINGNITKEQNRYIYRQILINLKNIKCIPEMNLGIHSLILLETWDIPIDTYIYIIDRFFNKPSKVLELLNELDRMDQKIKY